MAKMPAIPNDTVAAILAMKEIIERREGMRGSPGEKFITLADIAICAWQTPTFLNAWLNYGNGYSNAGFCKDASGVVRLRGLIWNGTVGGACFVLPTGYRPEQRELFSTISNGAIGRADVDTAGNVLVLTPSTNVWVSLNSVTFRAA